MNKYQELLQVLEKEHQITCKAADIEETTRAKVYFQLLGNLADKERFKWLASPYKNPAYKLSQFEYDLINAFDRCKECCLLNEIECLKKLREKGYFNGIDPFTKVHDIIDNCEVIE